MQDASFVTTRVITSPYSLSEVAMSRHQNVAGALGPGGERPPGAGGGGPSGRMRIRAFPVRLFADIEISAC